MSEDCLHCLLMKAYAKWLKSHNASHDQILEMVTRFTAQVTGGLPEHRDLEEIQVVILGKPYNHPRSSLH